MNFDNTITEKNNEKNESINKMIDDQSKTIDEDISKADVLKINDGGNEPVQNDENHKPNNVENINELQKTETVNSNLNEIETKNIDERKNDSIKKKEKIKKKKTNIASIISMDDKSERVREIICIALEVEKIEEERKRLKNSNRELKDECQKLSDKIKKLEELYVEKKEEIVTLRSDIDHRNEVIDIVKADKNESAQEYKNAVASSLRVFYNDFLELKDMEKTKDVGEALVDTLECVFDTLNKKGIIME